MGTRRARGQAGRESPQPPEHQAQGSRDAPRPGPGPRVAAACSASLGHALALRGTHARGHGGRRRNACALSRRPPVERTRTDTAPRGETHAHHHDALRWNAHAAKRTRTITAPPTGTHARRHGARHTAPRAPAFPDPRRSGSAASLRPDEKRTAALKPCPHRSPDLTPRDHSREEALSPHAARTQQCDVKSG